MTESQLQQSAPARRRLQVLNWLLWAAVPSGVVAIVLVRWTAHASDFAVGNVLSGLLALMVWLALIFAVARSTAPRSWWRSLLLVPLGLLLIFLAVYKFERFNGELVPQFTLRWNTAADARPQALQRGPIPDSKADADGPATVASAVTTARQITQQMIAPRKGDFPQYLGPSRDATLRQVRLNPNWDASPPRISWKQSIGEGWSGFAVQGDVAVTMEQRGQQEWVSAYSVLDGTLMWNSSIDARHSDVLGGVGPRSTPTIADNRVYACSAVSRLSCLDLATGQEIWAQELLALAGTNQSEFEHQVSWGRSASPLLVDDLVIIPLGGIGSTKQTLIAFDRTTGQERWRGGSDQISYASPILAELSGQPQILLVSEKQLAGYDVNSGAQLWSSPWPGSSSGAASVSQPVVVDASHVLLTKGYGEGCRLLNITLADNIWSVEVLWSNSAALRTKFTNSVVRDGYAYGLSDGILECVRLSDGQRQWKKGRYRHGQLLLVGDHLLITAENGQLVLLEANPEKMIELAKLPVLGDVTWNPAALAGNRLLMRNADEAACILLPLLENEPEN